MSATNRGAERKANDLYETPDYTIKSLFNALDLSKVHSFLEPCRASGRISDMIPNRVFKNWAEISEGVDYLTEEYDEYFDLIVTNPPFSLAKEFIEKSLREGRSVWYLLRINFLESKDRAEWWQGKEPTHLLTLSARPSFTGKGTDATAYAWFGWDYASVCKLNPGIHVLPYYKPKK
jgi:hypothetical protein